jgi:phosphoglycerate dehydrogenase-like enzyme
MSQEIVHLAYSLWPGMDQYQQRIWSISNRIAGHDISNLLDAERKGQPAASEKLDEILSEVEIIFGSIPENVIARSPKLKWIQSPLAGTEQFLNPEVIASSVMVTKARIHEHQITEAVFNMILMLARHSLEYFRFQQQHKRVKVFPVILHSRTLGIIGLGNVGKSIARLAKAFGMRVIASKNHVEGKYTNVDMILPPSGLHQLLREADFVVLIVPLTQETKDLIGEEELKLMKPGAFLINVARGGILDEDALIRALKEHRIAGAALDVLATDPLPLPPDSPLWDLDNVIITPHMAGQRLDYAELLTDQFCRNLRRYLKGKELLNVVDKRLKY